MVKKHSRGASYGDLKIENSIEKALVLDLDTQEW
jgi:hypothetical protein